MSKLIPASKGIRYMGSVTSRTVCRPLRPSASEFFLDELVTSEEASSFTARKFQMKISTSLTNNMFCMNDIGCETLQ